MNNMQSLQYLSTLPTPLIDNNGKAIDKNGWISIRRAEILELFSRHIYGKSPLVKKSDVSFSLVESDKAAMDNKAVRKQVRITVRGPRGITSFTLLLFVPKNGKKSHPCFLLLDHRNPLEHYTLEMNRLINNEYWPAEKIVDNGFVAARLILQEIDMDKDDKFKGGIHAIFENFEEGKRPPDLWGTIAAWAFGGSRAMDYFETDADIDEKRVAVIGHSRGGKTALWCGAQDERFAIVISNESGCTGAMLARAKRGERVKDINRVFPHWFCANYRAYEDKEETMPVDQHELLALIAPRPLYVGSAEIDTEVAPEDEFYSLKAAEPVYKLFGIAGLTETELPPINTPLVSHDNKLGYHIKEGGHSLKLYDWEQYIKFAQLNF